MLHSRTNLILCIYFPFISPGSLHIYTICRYLMSMNCSAQVSGDRHMKLHLLLYFSFPLTDYLLVSLPYFQCVLPYGECHTLRNSLELYCIYYCLSATLCNTVCLHVCFDSGTGVPCLGKHQLRAVHPTDDCEVCPVDCHTVLCCLSLLL